MPILVLGWDDQPEGTSVGELRIIDSSGQQGLLRRRRFKQFPSTAGRNPATGSANVEFGRHEAFRPKFVAESADAKRIDQAQANSVLSIISMELEAALQQAYDFAGLYLGKKPPTISLDRDFDFYRLLGQDVAVIGDLNERGAITDKTFLEILKSGEILPDTVDLNRN